MSTEKLVSAMTSRGNANYGKRNYDQAISDYSAVIALDPDNANYYNYRCWAFVLKGDAESALSDCNKSLELRPDDSNTLDSRGIAHLALGITKRLCRISTGQSQ